MSSGYSRRPNPFKKPPKKVIEELEKVEEAEAKKKAEEMEGWETFFTSSDRSTPGRLFDNPPERFLARLNYPATNAETVRKIIHAFNGDEEWKNYIDFSYHRPGQDVRYSLDDSKLRALGWKPVKIFDEEIIHIVKEFKNHFKW